MWAAAEEVEAVESQAMIEECDQSMLVVQRVSEGGLGCALESLDSCSIVVEGCN